MNPIIARGAEAIIEKKGKTIVKKRIRKGYRYPELDEKIRRLRTRSEARLLEKASALIPTAKIKGINEADKELVLEYIEGKKLAEILDTKKKGAPLMKEAGKSIATLHDAGIIHGDLTTSNMIEGRKTKHVHIIDFGLGFNSHRIEDKAVDLHVLKEALEAKHPATHKELYEACMKGYKTSKNASQVLKQLERVEKRGRYKANY